MEAVSGKRREREGQEGGGEARRTSKSTIGDASSNNAAPPAMTFTSAPSTSIFTNLTVPKFNPFVAA